MGFQRFDEAAVPLEQTAAEQHGLYRNAAVLTHGKTVDAVEYHGAYLRDGSVLRHEHRHGAAQHEVRFRVCAQHTRQQFQVIGIKEIVIVQKVAQRSPRRRKPPVAVGCTAVEPAIVQIAYGQLRKIPLHHFPCRRRAVLRDDDLKIAVCLPAQALQRALQCLRPAAGAHNDGNERRFLRRRKFPQASVR